jgi:hypothetical protein
MEKKISEQKPAGGSLPPELFIVGGVKNQQRGCR